jgi:hypothetical protein
MNKVRVHTLLIVGAFSLPLQGAEIPNRRSGIGPDLIPKNLGYPTADTTTDSQLVARREAAASGQSVPKPIPPKSQGFGLLEMSTILQSGQYFTLLPKGSVVWCPPSLSSHVASAPNGRFTDWLTFLSSNRAWISTFEVTREQIAGKVPLPPETIERHRKGSLLVIATFQGGPISLPIKTP